MLEKSQTRGLVVGFMLVFRERKGSSLSELAHTLILNRR